MADPCDYGRGSPSGYRMVCGQRMIEIASSFRIVSYDINVVLLIDIMFDFRGEMASRNASMLIENG